MHHDLTALASLFQGLRDPAGTFLHMLANGLAHFVDGGRREIENALSQYLFSTTDVSVHGRPITENPSLRRLNLGLVVASDVLLTAVVLIASLRSMFERSIRARYGLKTTLPRVMVAIVLMHASLLLMQMAIDLNNALSHVALSLGDELHVDGLPWSPTISASAVERVSTSQDLFHGVFAVAMVVAVILLIFAYVVRYALLAVLIVTAPLAALCSVLPDTRNHTHTWLRLFTVTVFMQAVQIIVLRVASVLALDPSGGLVQTLYGLATLYLLLKVPGALNTAAHLETRAHTMGKGFERSLKKALTHGHHVTRRHAT